MKADHIVEALTGDSGWKDMIPQVNSSDFPTQWVPSAYECSIIDAQAKEIEKLRGQLPRWIPVEERLPDYDDLVLVTASGKPKENITLDEAVELATLYSDGWCLETWPEWTGAKVTHWMPLPEPPEVENAETK